MNFDEYQAFGRTTAIFPSNAGITYCALKLCGEAGEVAEKVGKFARDKAHGVTNADFIATYPEEFAAFREAVKLELGDNLWYIAQLAAELGIKLSDVVEANVTKLSSRRARGVVSGSGDNR